MADIITIGHPQDVNARGGKSLNTGSMRRSYNMKKEKKSHQKTQITITPH